MEINIKFSEQAELILKKIPDIDKEKVIEWFIKKGVLIGGGDILDYLKNTEVKNG
jgi:hypothetical protein